MFTGIVQAVGQVVGLEARGGDRQLHIATGKFDLGAVRTGDSIAVSGVCLTVVEKFAESFSADVSAETLRCTTFDALQVGSQVNLERALTLATPLGGHLVSGHVDGVATVQERAEVGDSVRFVIELPAMLAKYVAVKGSVCVDGVSLTVNGVQDARFEVNLVPHTLRETTLGALDVGSRVNIEVDLLARYLERLLASAAPVRVAGLSRETLVRSGFLDE